MKTLALFFILMTALSVTHGKRRFNVAKKSQYLMKTWIIYYFDRQLDRFLKRTAGKFKLTPDQLKVLRYTNRLHMVRNCNFYRKFATIYLRRRKRLLSGRNYGTMGRYIGLHVRMGWRYYRMIAKKKIPKLTKSMEKTLAKNPGNIIC
ncbi:uncharacterized protein LOC124256173 [Haliotis rubra]|uniref:uncharacterized protein LOC124256173 n=1 Tax=Haliotis rubra TaxID=36100 RepID=UPI001EE5D0D1|nr:uncharacterized protein LOC124256173 [Haliotis rubra]